MKSTSKNSNNRVSSQICNIVRTPTSSMSSSFFSSSPSKHSNSSLQQSAFGSNCSNSNSSGHFGSPLSKQQHLASSASSLCPTTSTVLSTFGNKAQSVAQSKAANLNAIINNIASANNGAASVGASGSHNNSTLDSNSNPQSVQCQQNRTGNMNMLDHSVTSRPNSATFSDGQQNSNNNFRSTVAAAQQLLSGSGNTLYSSANFILKLMITFFLTVFYCL